MDGERVPDSKWQGDFDRIVNTSFHDRPEPLGPYMRWPLGAALALVWAQVATGVLDALVAASLLTAGHSPEVTTGALGRTLALTSSAALALGWAAHTMRSRLLVALDAALVVETIEVVGRGLSVARAGAPQVGDYVGLAWAVAALVTLAAPSSRAFCTRRRTASVRA